MTSAVRGYFTIIQATPTASAARTNLRNPETQKHVPLPSFKQPLLEVTGLDLHGGILTASFQKEKLAQKRICINHRSVSSFLAELWKNSWTDKPRARGWPILLTASGGRGGGTTSVH